MGFAQFFSAQVDVYRGMHREQTELMLLSQVVEWFKAKDVSALEYGQRKKTELELGRMSICDDSTPS